MPKLVVCSPNIKSRALKGLANILSEKVGYRVYRVIPSRLRRRLGVHFLLGMDKVEQFQRFAERGVSAPSFALSLDAARALDCKQVVVRQLTNSSEGRGITICNREEVGHVAPLYTAYIPKKKEFRVHIWNSEVIDITEKRKRKEHNDERDTQIRNTANGYVFCRSDLVIPDDLQGCALAAVNALDRSYGAVDLIWNQKQNKCYVLEVNSRPGMEGTTLEKYSEAILRGIQ